LYGNKNWKESIDFIFEEETGGKYYYEKNGAHPCWPKGSSGITVGAGYDCGYKTAKDIRADWTGLISDDMIKLLEPIAGLRGQKASNALTSALIAGVYIPYDVAYKQYLKRVIKPEISLTANAFPELDKLNPDTVGVLTSIVYNRGTGMKDLDAKAQDRKEMREIKALVPKKDYKGIAAQIRSMKRLWDGVPDYVGDHENKFSGLVGRREREAVLVDNSNRVYTPEEILSFTI
jgi:hypothetical protein